MKEHCSLVVLLICNLTVADDSQSVPATTTDPAADEILAICEGDVIRFCSTVNPGEGRILACLQAYHDQVSEECGERLGSWVRPVPIEAYQSIGIYPTLEDRELGEANIDEDGERVIWKQKLPFFAQQVVDLGFDLPNPYGVAIIPLSFEGSDLFPTVCDATPNAPLCVRTYSSVATPIYEGTIAVFVGATYLRAEVDIAGEIEFETPGGPAGVTYRF